MILFASRLRQRAEELRISNAEAARRVGLSERRYAHYVSGKREPDLATLVRIAEVLGTTPNWLLGTDTEDGSRSAAQIQTDRLMLAARAMTAQDIEALVVQAEAVAKLRASHRQQP